MKGSKGLGRGVVAAAVIALALIGGVIAHSQVTAQSSAVSIGSLTQGLGDQGSVDLQALNIDAPGLGAWTIDIVYNPATISVASCTGESGSVCNPNLDPDTIRVVGASTGLAGDNRLASITFKCRVEGSSDLRLSVEQFAMATDPPQEIDPAVQNGSVTCGISTPTPVVAEVVALPVTGGTGLHGSNGGSYGGGGWALAYALGASILGLLAWRCWVRWMGRG